MDIRLEQPADFNAIHELVRVAFDADEGPGVADLVRAIREDDCYRPGMAFVAVDGDETVGHVMIDGCWVRGPAGDRPIVMLSPLAVAPTHRCRGIGSALIEAAVAAADAAGEPYVALEGSPKYYGARGFDFAGDHGLSLPLPGWAPREAAQVRLLSMFDSTEATLRGDVVYPPPFDNLV